MLSKHFDSMSAVMAGVVMLYDGRKAPELFAHQRGDIGLENIGGDDLEVIVARHGLFQDRQQRLVKLHGHHLARALAELVAQCTDAGADLEHAVLLVCARALGDLIGDGGVDQKILPHGLGKMKTMAL